MGQVPPAKPRSLIQHLTASQYLQHLLKPAKAQQLELHSPRQQPSVVALCVDHALRSASHSECQNASSQAAAMGMESHVMQMQWPEKPRSGHLMEQASITRYKLLHLACKARQISVLLTGHHAGEHTLFSLALQLPMHRLLMSAMNASVYKLCLSRLATCTQPCATHQNWQQCFASCEVMLL